MPEPPLPQLPVGRYHVRVEAIEERRVASARVFTVLTLLLVRVIEGGEGAYEGERFADVHQNMPLCPVGDDVVVDAVMKAHVHLVTTRSGRTAQFTSFYALDPQKDEDRAVLEDWAQSRLGLAPGEYIIDATGGIYIRPEATCLGAREKTFEVDD